MQPYTEAANNLIHCCHTLLAIARGEHAVCRGPKTDLARIWSGLFGTLETILKSGSPTIQAVAADAGRVFLQRPCVEAAGVSARSAHEAALKLAEEIHRQVWLTANNGERRRETEAREKGGTYHAEPATLRAVEKHWSAICATLKKLPTLKTDKLLVDVAAEADRLPPLKRAGKTKEGRKLEKARWTAEAMILIRENPDAKNAEIAKVVGVHPSQLSRSPEFKAAKKQAQLRSPPKKGRVDRDRSGNPEVSDEDV